MKPLQAGDTVPALSATSHDGQKFSLQDFRGLQSVVVFFYPKDNTSVCTAEACSFRDAYEDFVSAGAAVIGVSSDPPDSHRAFADKHRLPFLLVSDSDGTWRRAFGVPKPLWILPGRVTYVIDRQGIIRHVFSALMQGPQHMQEALQVVRELNGTTSQ
ncbi:MAG: peroxiredoxin [Pirellulales bacterium]